MYIVAHRGHASRFPENSRAGIEAACAAGAAFVEFDVQLTADGEPVVLHDPTLARTAGLERRIRELTLAEARGISISEPERFGEAFADERLASLAEVVELLARWPAVRPMVEIKRESAEEVGVDATVERVVRVLEPLLDRAVVISFVERAVLTARRLGVAEVGWCLNYYDADARRLAEAMAPDYLATERHRLPAGGERPWPGPWRWMCWEVTNRDTALALHRRGVALIETMACAELLAALSG